jgi:hypothetical protein
MSSISIDSYRTKLSQPTRVGGPKTGVCPAISENSYWTTPQESTSFEAVWHRLLGSGFYFRLSDKPRTSDGVHVPQNQQFPRVSISVSVANRPNPSSGPALYGNLDALSPAIVNPK